MKKLVIVVITLVMALSLLAINTGAALACEYVGLTPGYWKNHTDIDEDWGGIDPNAPLQGLFSYDLSNFSHKKGGGTLAEDSLLDALNYQGGNGDSGGARILLRAAVAAYLNSENLYDPVLDIAYPVEADDVRSMTNEALGKSREDMLALAGIFDGYNNLGL